MREADAGERRQVVGADPGAHHLLDHDPHLFVEIEETHVRAVLDRVRTEDRGVDLADRVHQAAQPLGLGALVRHEKAFVLSRKRGADPVLEQARAAHDQRHLPEVLERERQAVRELGGKRRVPEDLHDVRVLPPDLLDIEVLVVVDVVELIVLDEAEDAVGGEIPGARNADRPELVGKLRCAPDDRIGEQQAGTLASELAVAAGGGDRAMQHAVVIADADEGLRLVDELRVVGQQPARE